MSGHRAMSVTLSDESVGGDDERMTDVCVTFAEALVRMAAGVIMGVKPAAIFSLPMRAYSAGRWRQLLRRPLDEALRAYTEALPAYGLSLNVLWRTDRRVYLMVWRRQALAQTLEREESLAILRECGYVSSTVEGLLVELRRRLIAYYREPREAGTTFPHEIGVFLGYPAEDVRGFMEGKKPTCKGAWCAYGDVCVAQRRFELLEQHERACRLRFASGESLHALLMQPGAC